MTFSDNLTLLQAWIFEQLVQPSLFALGLGEFVEDAFEGVEWFVLGAVQLLLLFVILRPLEAWLPVQIIGSNRARWNDFTYTALHRLGAFTVLVFFILTPIFDQVSAWLHLEGIKSFNLEDLWSGFLTYPALLFFAYLFVLDFFDYWYHRASHHFDWWWGLHSLHHSQREMNLWSDNRNHVLDDLLRDVYMGLIALVIGVEPGQYMLTSACISAASVSTC